MKPIRLLLSLSICCAASLAAQAQTKTFSIGMRAGGAASIAQYKAPAPAGLVPLAVYNGGVFAVWRKDLSLLALTGGISYRQSGYKLETPTYPMLGDQAIGAPIKPGKKAPTAPYEERTYYHYLTGQLGGRFYFSQSTKGGYLGAAIRVGRLLGINKLVTDPEWFAATDRVAAGDRMEGQANQLMSQGVFNLGYQHRQFFMELEAAPFLTNVQMGSGRLNPDRFLHLGANLGYLF